MKCLICTAPTDAFACKSCAETARRQLSDMADLLDPHALDQRRAGVRGISYAHIGGKSSGERPLPFNPRVGEAEALAYGTLYSIWRELDEDEPSVGDQVRGVTTSSDLAAWLAQQVMNHLRYMPQADEMFDDIADKHRVVIRLWDNPPEQTFIGMCGAPIEVEGGCDVTCTEAVYAERGKLTTKCPRCQAEHDVQARYAELLHRCADHLATLSEIEAFLLPVYGNTVKRRRLRYYVDSGRLESKGEQPQWRTSGAIVMVPVYRIADVETAIANDAKRQAKKKHKAAA